MSLEDHSRRWYARKEAELLKALSKVPIDGPWATFTEEEKEYAVRDDLVIEQICRYNEFRNLTAELRDNVAIAFEAIRRNDYRVDQVLPYASDKVRNSKDLYLAIISVLFPPVDMEDFHDMMQYVPEDVKTDKEFLIGMLKLVDSMTAAEESIKYVPDSYLADKEFMLEACKANETVFQYASDELKSDYDVAGAVICTYFDNIVWVPDEALKDMARNTEFVEMVFQKACEEGCYPYRFMDALGEIYSPMERLKMIQDWGDDYWVKKAAEELMIAGDFENAIIYLKLVPVDPYDEMVFMEDESLYIDEEGIYTKVYDKIGYCYHRLGDEENADRYFDKGMKLGDAACYFRKGMSICEDYLEDKADEARLDEATGYLQQASDMDHGLATDMLHRIYSDPAYGRYNPELADSYAAKCLEGLYGEFSNDEDDENQDPDSGDDIPFPEVII